MISDPKRHTNWCAQGHQCAVELGEHRANPITVRIPGAGKAALTRVREPGGEYAEVRMRVALPPAEPQARARLTALLTHLRTLIGPEVAP